MTSRGGGCDDDNEYAVFLTRSVFHDFGLLTDFFPKLVGLFFENLVCETKNLLEKMYFYTFFNYH